MPLISIIIPTYNRALLLKEAIDSVLSQTFQNFELIIIDDGSTDNTKNICKEHQSIRYIYQNNQGVSAARNKGIALASAKFIAFLDSDDLWLPMKLEKQLKFFSNNPQTLITQTNEKWLRDGKIISQKKHHQKKSENIFERSLASCLISPSTIMVRKKIFEEVGLFDERLPACEDYDLWLRITYKYSVPLIKDELTIKRAGHLNQLSETPCLDKYRIESIKKLLNNPDLTTEQKEIAKQVLAKKYQIYEQGCQKRGKNINIRNL
ncbi:MAG: glycosyltransferase [bacterium]|nr:glycosyltransferase [bacterium]